MREEENNKSSQKKGSRKKVIQLFPKRKASTIYLTGAAVILAGAMIFQLATGNSGKTEQEQGLLEQGMSGGGSEESLPVSDTTEEIKMPVLEENGVSVVKHFYDANASEEEQQEALIYYDNQYTKNTGTSFASEDGSAFEVAAALSGTVANVEEDPLLGNVVELEHGNDLTTVYQSLADVQVEVGDTVSQGEVIGKAGQSVIGKDLGNHVHFEIRNDGVAVNPETSFDKTVGTLQDELNKASEESASSEEEATVSGNDEGNASEGQGTDSAQE